MSEAVKLTQDEAAQIIREHVGREKGWPSGTMVRVGFVMNVKSSGGAAVGAELVGVEVEPDLPLPAPARPEEAP